MANSPVGWLALLRLSLVMSGLAYGLYFSAARAEGGGGDERRDERLQQHEDGEMRRRQGETLAIGAIVGGVLMLGAVAALRPRQTTPAPAPGPAPAQEAAGTVVHDRIKTHA